MLKQLKIEHVAVIDSAEVSMTPGFNVLTGETGAGKSLIVESINMVTGERTSREIIPTGEKKSSVEALFSVEREDARLALEEAGFPPEDGEILLSRQIFADGRNVCRINGQMATVSLLRTVGRMLIDIHGQQDSQALLNKDSHISFLDDYTGEELKSLIADYQKEFFEWKRISRELERVSLNDEEKKQREELLRFQIDEIEKFEPWNINEEELKNERSVLKNAEKIKKVLFEAVAALTDSDGYPSANDLFSSVCGILRETAKMDSNLEKLSEEAADIQCHVQDLASDLSRYESNISIDEERLEEITDILDGLSKLKRKYGDSAEKIEEYYEKAQAELKELTYSAEKIEEYTVKEREIKRKLDGMADEISKYRKEAATLLEQAVMRELEELNMPKVSFEVHFEEKGISENGKDDVEFLLSTVPGEKNKPLTKIASGGEMARIMLALKTVLADGDMVDTLIFDEIDTGVSGKAAIRIAEKLRALSSKKQILCITHLPQMSAAADSHFLVQKDFDSFRTHVYRMDEEERVKELARMMGGEVLTDSLLEGARELRKQYM